MVSIMEWQVENRHSHSCVSSWRVHDPNPVLSKLGWAVESLWARLQRGQGENARERIRAWLFNSAEPREDSLCRLDLARGMPSGLTVSCPPRETPLEVSKRDIGVYFSFVERIFTFWKAEKEVVLGGKMTIFCPEGFGKIEILFPEVSAKKVV